MQASKRAKIGSPLLTWWPPFLVHFSFAPAPSSATEVGRGEPEIAHNHALPFHCTSTACCHYFRFWSSHGSIASEDNGAYYFQWAPSGGFNGPAITRTKTHWEATRFLVIKMAVSLCEAKERPFSLSACWIWKGQERQFERNKQDSSPGALCPGQMYVYEQLTPYRIGKFSKVKPPLPLISYL